ncbi:phage tail protein [uncultured Roseibium sp.]|uniref:phage tail protein n=1 Tax=uncultured Roseibium sp. TaxID=1936171 RepID=UPI00260DCA12|nr:phage tail protein [uncultured Roseibium sp.]
MATFTPPINPTYQSQESVDFNVLEANFGDNYRQRTPDGLNAKNETYKVKWDVLSLPDGQTIYDFFEARGGYEAFDYTLPGEVSSKKWTCKQFTRTRSGPDHVSISAEFRREYDN